MTARGLLVVAVALLAGALLVFTVGAQVVAPQPCGESVACLRHRVKDLTDYREFVDDQLALAKALNESLQAQLAACRPLELPPKPEPER